MDDYFVLFFMSVRSLKHLFSLHRHFILEQQGRICGRLLPPRRLGLGTSLGRRCTLYFSLLLILSHGFAWKLNWEACRAEGGTMENSHQRMIFFFFLWMPATFSTGSFEYSSLFSRFLVIDWCSGVLEGTLFFFSLFRKTGLKDWGKQWQYSKPLRSCFHHSCPISYE